MRCEISEQSPKDTKTDHSPQQQSVRPAAVEQNIQKYPLPYHQSIEQFFPQTETWRDEGAHFTFKYLLFL